MRRPVPATGWKRALEVFNTVLMTVLKPMQIIGNFVFLTLAYVLGVGVSALLYRLGPGRASAPNSSSADSPSGSASETWWRTLPPAPRDRDSWLRPF